MIIPIKVKMKVSESSPLKLKINELNEPFGLKLSSPITMVSGIPYEGNYEVTPSSETQILSTEMLYMTSNVTINPIPNNYGLITWNGSILTVS